MKRADLYKLVWERPVTHVAKEFGISDVAIRKICAKHGIPTPPLGYWAKLQHGKKVKQTPLPEPKDGQSDDIDLVVRATQSLPPEVTEVRRAALQDEAREENRITVPRIRPPELHPIAAATEKALRKAKPDDEDFVTRQGATVPDVRIGPGSIDRVVLLIHTILHGALDRRHGIVTDSGLKILVDEQPLAVRISRQAVRWLPPTFLSGERSR